MQELVILEQVNDTIGSTDTDDDGDDSGGESVVIGTILYLHLDHP